MRPQALGPELYEGVLSHHLDPGLEVDRTPPGAAEDDLERTLEELASVAARFRRGNHGRPHRRQRRVRDHGLRRQHARHPVGRRRRRPARGRGFRVRTRPRDGARARPAPRTHASCAPRRQRRRGDAWGPLEQADLPTVIGISPAPDSWDSERQDSFHPQYNLTCCST